MGSEFVHSSGDAASPDDLRAVLQGVRSIARECDFKYSARMCLVK